MAIEVDGCKMWASCHMDKQPMSLIHTCNTMLKGPARYRAYAGYKIGKVIRRKFKLE